jgi:membrane associated rhomboid family serine protease
MVAGQSTDCLVLLLHILRIEVWISRTMKAPSLFSSTCMFMLFWHGRASRSWIPRHVVNITRPIFPTSAVDKVTPLSVLNTGVKKLFTPRVLECAAAAETMTFLSKRFGKDPTDVLSVINGIIYFVWQYTINEEDNKLLTWMIRHFCMPHDKEILQQRPHTIMLSAFSHMTASHITGNLSMLKLVGPTVTEALGPRQFSYFYMASIYASNVFVLWVHEPLQRWMKTTFQVAGKQRPFLRILSPRSTYSLGASGAISALFTFSCLHLPKKSFNLGSEDDAVAVPAAVAGWAYFLLDLLQAVISPRDSTIGHGAHLGGYVFGAVVYFVHRFVRKRRVGN